ncbi:MAG: hypothetical protein H0X26_00120 [Alphaproteobacteria bacterium]|nr:hypothetical protein [Alphaproteobacteria bacterium]
MAYLFLGAFGFILLILLLQKLEHAETKLLVQTLKWTLVGVLVLSVFYLTLVGRLLHVAALVALLVILLKKDVHSWVQKKPPPPALPSPMTKKEACALLKVDLNASVEEIEAAYKKQKPKDSTKRDRLAQARDVLLKGKTR